MGALGFDPSGKNANWELFLFAWLFFSILCGVIAAVWQFIVKGNHEK
jgi:hypothetical protein